MKLSLQLATISYCPDLTDPNAFSVPIAVLGLGQNLNDAGSWCAGVVGVDATRIGIDPLSSAMLADVPHVIRSHVDGAMQRLTVHAMPGAVLREVQESLNTSIHVSDIGARQELEVAEPGQIPQALIELSHATLEAAFKTLAEALRRRGQWTPRVSPRADVLAAGRSELSALAWYVRGLGDRTVSCSLGPPSACKKASLPWRGHSSGVSSLHQGASKHGPQSRWRCVVPVQQRGARVP